MSQKQFSAADQPESEQPPNSQMNMAAGRRKTSESGQRSEDTNFSSLESGSLNGDEKRSGKSRRRRRRRRKRSSNSENGTEKVNNQTKADEKPEENVCQPSSTAPGLSGLQKPTYDRAEAAFYENLYNNTSRSNDHPQSLVEVEEDTEADEQEVAAVEEVRVIQQGKAEVFHALHPIQEEAEPVEAAEKEDESGASVCFFLHPDNERVWLNNGSNMSTVDNLAQEQIWFEKPRYDEAERHFYEHVYSSSQPQEAQDAGANTILQDIARAQENIQKTLAGSTASSTNANTADQEILSRIKNLELENQSLYKALSKLECRVALLEKTPAAAAAPSVPCTNGKSAPHKSRALVKEEDNDDDIDLFGSDEDDDEAEKLKEQRLKEYAEKKAKKPALIAKSSILLDVKPWDDETDMVKLEECVRSIQTDGLLWGTSKLVPVGYGIKKLQITCVVEDDKVGTDLLEEEITKFEDFVQSVDVAAFNKI